MDLREIQALHAHYAGQPVTIDIAGQVASMPALPAPDDASAHRAVSRGVRRIVRPVSIGLAIGALAIGTVLGAYHLFLVIHAPAPMTAAPKKEAAAPATVPMLPSALSAPQDPPINVTPVRPLTSRDLGGGSPAPQSALSSIDLRQLSPETGARAGEPRTASTTTQPALASAAASPIHASRESSVSATAPATTAPTTPAATLEPAEAPRTPEAAATAAPTYTARPAEKAVHRPVHRRAAEPATEKNAGTSSPAPEAIKASTPAGKSGDVQLF